MLSHGNRWRAGASHQCTDAPLRPTAARSSNCARRVGLTCFPHLPTYNPPTGRVQAVAESAYTLPCQLALTSVGYRSLPIDGAPFDERRAIVPNSKGRVDGEPGLYTVGWLKRGPSGIILTNVNDAAETVDTLLQDRKVQTASGVEGAEKGGDDEIRDILDAHGGVVLDFAAVRRIAEAEVRRGEGIGKVREKFVSVQELLEAAR
eukprot:scaffold14007_cov27-Tisochrysis_lutea.AAC.2